jgi:N-acetylmuramoyl-L-alanine amidase
MMKRSDLKELLLTTFGNLTDYQLMALTIYGEARGEKYEGKVAVGSVILERVDHRDWDGKNIQEVCLMPYQFSCYLPNDKNFNALKAIANDWDNKIKQSQPLRECLNITGLLLSQSINRTPEIAKYHATQYLTASLRKSKACPAWVKKLKLVAAVGSHEFYC